MSISVIGLVSLLIIIILFDTDYSNEIMIKICPQLDFKEGSGGGWREEIIIIIMKCSNLIWHFQIHNNTMRTCTVWGKY